MQFVKTADERIVELHEDGTWQYSEPHGSSLNRLQEIEASPEVIELAKGLFERIGVRVIDTKEEFTCIHAGDKLKFTEGIDQEDIDFRVDIYAFQIDRVLRNISEGYRSELARFYLIREFFLSSPMGKRNLLNNPLVSNPVFRFVIKGKNIVHIYLVSPDQSREKDATFTLFYLNGHWNIARGLCGEPKRVFNISVDDAFELQRHIYQGMKSNSFGEWYRVAKWYVGWRSKVERPPS